MDVLLATFNGGKYLEEQLESLVCQEGVTVRVWANDDGSTDETLAILKKWQRKGLIKDISKSQGVGSTGAFLRLLSEHSDSEYVAFCDQDDIWEPKKLAMQLLKITNCMPACVTSQRLFIDNSNRIIGVSKKLRRSPSFENAMFENIAPGNTLLLNNQAINAINRYQDAPIKYYDSWIYLLLTFVGKVEYIHQPLIRYRIHETNLVGLRKYNVGRFIDSAESYLSQIRFLNEINERDLKQGQNSALTELRLISECKGKIKKVISILKYPLERQRRIDQVGIKLTLLVLVLSSRF
ncbi:WcaA Glycosyltransferases involved in cell wall biogenesis [Candidatus Nanopelagicaceae bacterium]